MKNKDFYNLNFLWFDKLKHEDTNEVEIFVKYNDDVIYTFMSEICPKCALSIYDKWLESEHIE